MRISPARKSLPPLPWSGHPAYQPPQFAHRDGSADDRHRLPISVMASSSLQLGASLGATRHQPLFCIGHWLFGLTALCVRIGHIGYRSESIHQGLDINSDTNRYRTPGTIARRECKLERPDCAQQHHDNADGKYRCTQEQGNGQAPLICVHHSLFILGRSRSVAGTTLDSMLPAEAWQVGPGTPELTQATPVPPDTETVLEVRAHGSRLF